jgi:RHS repeat-associated protein
MMNGAAAGDAFIVVKASGYNDGIARGLWQFGNAGGSLYTNSDGNLYDDFGTNNRPPLGLPTVPLNKFNVYNATSTSSEWTNRFNGVVYYTRNSNTVSFNTSANIGGGGASFDGDIAEIIVYDQELTQAQRDTVNAYLGNKYALSAPPPVAPTSLGATALSATQVSLTWQAQQGAYYVNYLVYRSTDGGTTFTQVAIVPNILGYTDTGLAAGTNYVYEVSAQDNGGTSAYSNTTAVTTLLLPSAPTSLGATALSDTQISLGWQAQQGGSSVNYLVYRSTDGGATFTKVAIVPNSLGYTDTGLAPGTSYTYEVSAQDMGGISGYSNPATAATLPSAPVFAPAAGTYTSAQSVTITSAGATAIYYTNNGATPTLTSTLYTGAVPVANNTVLQAIGVNGGVSSLVASASYTILPPAPVFNPAPGTYPNTTTLSVAISDAAGSTIYYTTNGSTPTTASTQYTTAVVLPGGTSTLSAIAVTPNGSSAVTTGTYVLKPPPPLTPVFSPVGGTYTGAQLVTIASAGATAIYYTTDGNTPTATSALYNGGVTVAGNTVLQAIGVNPGGSSPVASASYTILASAPVFSPAPGTYATATTFSVAISDTALSTIYYTTDGTPPTAASTQYTTAVVLPGGTTTLNAIAVNGNGSSTVTSGTYVVKPLAPVFSPAPGTYSNSVSVSLTPMPANATVYFTTDGSIPAAGSSAYTGPITVSTSTRIKAIDVENNQGGDMADGLFAIGNPPGTATPTSGFAATYYQAANFSGSTVDRLDPVIDFPATGGSIPANTGSAMWTGTLTAQYTDTYTFNISSDGNPSLWVGNSDTSTPPLIDGSGQTSYQKLSGTISLVAGQTYPVILKYVVRSSNSTQERLSLTWSAVAFAEELIPTWQVTSGLAYANTASTPTASPAAGTITDGTSITLSTSTPGANIYYTLDGSTPTTGSALYTLPIVLHSGVTLQAIAAANNYNNSGILVTSYTIDRTGPTLSNLTFNGAAVPGVIATDGTFGITATSNVGVQQVQFSLDGTVIGTDTTTTAAGQFIQPITLSTISDGAHTLTIQAFDNLGLPSNILTTPITIALASPPPPVITAPPDGTKVNVNSITVRGTAQVGSTVTLYNGTNSVGSAQAAADGSFAITVSSLTPVPGTNPFTATAQNRNPTPSAASNSVTVTYDNTVPNPPTALSAQAGANGVIKLSWHPSSGVQASGYYLYRSTSAIPDNAVLDPSTAVGGLLQGLTYTDTPPSDGHYYYRMVTVYAVGASATFSALSNQADAVANSTPPSATVALQPIGTAFDATNHLLGQGLVQVTLTASEPLSATPFLNFSVGGNGAIFVNLTATGSNNAYTGVITITASTPSGVLTPLFSGIDVDGNHGSVATMVVPWAVATTGPNATGLTPVQADASGNYQPVPVFDAINNVPVAPATAVTVSWQLTLNAAPKPGTAPVCTATLSGHPGLVLPVTVADTSDGNPLTWIITLTLPADAGAVPENLALAYTVSDALGNIGSTIVPPHVFQVYQGNLPPLAVPSGLTATPQPAGAINLTWNTVPNASAYVLQVQGPGQSAYQDLTTIPSGATTSYVYTTTGDGLYSYEIASVRSDNGQQSISSWSTPPASALAESVPPNAPTNLSLQVIPQGVEATWAAPANNSDVTGYALYRSGSAITSVASMTPIIADIPAGATFTVDSAPNGSMPNYALVAFDAAGNQSAIVTGFADVGLLPVGTLQVAQADQTPPVLTWAPAPGSVIDGYNLLVDNAPISLNGATLIPLATTTYNDPNYTGVKDRTYTVATVSGPSSVSRSLVLPVVSISLDPNATIIRGLVNAVNVILQNNSTTSVTITDASLDVQVDGHDHGAGSFITLAPGAQQTVPVVVGGYADLSTGTTPVSVILTIIPNAGEQVTLTRSFTVPVTEGAFTAQVIPTNMVSGGTGSVTFTLTNPSTEPIEFKVAQQNDTQPSSEARIQVLDLKGDLLSTTPLQFFTGTDVIMLADGTTVVSIPAGATYTSPPIPVPVPLNAPAMVNVALGIDSVYYNFGDPDTQITLNGPSSVAQASTQVAPYSATITSITPSVSSSNNPQPIVIQGAATWQGTSTPATGVPLSLYIKNGSFIQQYTVLTDGNGNFSYAYQPGATETGGIYSVWASHPSVTAPSPNPSTFTITSVIVSPSQLTVNAPRNYTQVLPVQVTTGPGASVTNLRAVLSSETVLPADVSFAATPLATVGASQTVTLPLSLTGLAPTATSLDRGELIFNVVSDAPGGGAPLVWGTVTVDYIFSLAQPFLSGTPGTVQIGVQPGGTGSGNIDLKNTGLSSLDSATITLVSTDGSAVPAWIQLGTAGNLSSLDVGQDVNVTISAAPPANPGLTIPQVYQLNVHVQADNDTQDFPVTVTVSPSGQGGADFKVIDAYFGFTLPNGAANPSINGVPGAVVSLQNVTSDGIPTVSQGATTDSNGEADFSNLPAGSYQLSITSNNHDTYTSNITIQPGLTSSQEITLTFEPVTFSWSVVPVTFQDTYNVVLNATFQTQVPAPVVVVEPASIAIPAMCAGQVATGQMKLTNYGLIAAQQVTLTPPTDDANFSYAFSSNFGDTIPAGQSVTVTYTITCLQPLPGQCPAVSGGGGGGGSSPCGPYASGGFLGYIYVCIAGVEVPVAVPFYFTAGWVPCPGNGNTPPPGTRTPGTIHIGPPPQGGPRGASGGPSNISGSGGVSDDCFPQPPPCYGPDCCKHNTPVGSWVDITSRQYTDQATDLSVPVPNGRVSVSREFKFDRWSFRATDDFYALTDGAQNPDLCALVINGDYYTDPSASFGLIQGSTIGLPQYVEGETFLKYSIGPEEIQASNGLFVWTDGAGNERDYDPATDRLVSTKFRGQLVASYNYDSSGNLSTIVDSTSRTIFTFSYDANNNLTGVQDLAGRQVSYTYDSAGRLATATDAVGTVTTYTYDNEWNPTSKLTHIANTPTTQDDLETISYQVFPLAPGTPAIPPVRVVPGSPYFSYVARGQVLSVSHSTGSQMSFVYHYNSADQTYDIVATSAEGVVTESLFDQNNQLISQLVNGQQVYAKQYNATTEIVTLGQSEQTTTQYDAFGNVVSVTYPDQTTESYTYDPTVNKVSSYTNQMGVVTTYTYDALGNQLTKTEAVGTPLQRVTTDVYYPNTNLLQLHTDPLGRQTEYLYDSENNLIRSYDPANPAHQTQYTYDILGNKLTMTDALGNVTTYAYDAAGHLISETNPLNQQTLYTYQGNNIVQIETGRTAMVPGRIMRYGYDSLGHRTAEKWVDAQGNETVFKTYAYDGDGRLVSATNALGQSITYAYDAFGNQNTVSQPDDEGGLSTVQTNYDLLGRDIQTTDSLGAITQKTYDLRNRVVKLTEATGTPIQRSTSYTYDALGHVLTEQYSDVIAPNRTYTTTYTYDALGRKISTGGDHSYAMSYAYDAGDQLVGETDALGRVTTFDYDNYGRQTDIKLNGRIIKSYGYDLVGNEISKTDGVGNHRHRQFDALNRIVATSIPLSATQAIPDSWWTQPAYILQSKTYTTWGETASTTDYNTSATGSPLLATTSSAYDTFGRKVSETEATGLTLTYTYDAADNLLTTTYPSVASSGQTLPTTETYLRSPYNASLVDAFEDRSGHVTNYSYDEALRQREITTSLGAVTDFTFDALGRVATKTDPAGTTSYAYDLFDHPVQVTDPDNVPDTHVRIETFAYDNFGKLVQQTGADKYPITYTYDAVGNKIAMTDADNHETQWTYTDRNLVATKTYADGTSYAYTYDGADHPLTRQDALGRTTTYAYNAQGLKASITYPDDPAVIFTYDQQGNMLSMTDGSGLTTWTYDLIGRTASETQTSSHRTLTYSHDNYGRRIGLNVTSTDGSDSPWQTTYGYDNASRLQSVLDSRSPAAQPFIYTYAANSNLISQITTPTGLQENKTYDTLGRLVSISALSSPVVSSSNPSNGSTINSFTYTYDAAGQRVTETTLDYQQNFTYDAKRELTQANKTLSAQSLAFNHSYAYDGIGNRQTSAFSITGSALSSSNGSSTTAYTTNAVNQYTAITEQPALSGVEGTTVNPSYDANGNTLAIQSLDGGGTPMTLRYDEENRLVEASNSISDSVYTYDGLGRRVEAKVLTLDPTSGLWTLASDLHYVYDSRRVLEELNSNYVTLRSYTRGLDMSRSLEGAGGIGGLLALTTYNLQPTTYNYFYDGNGNIIDLVGDDGSEQAHYQYSPFGERLSATGALASINPYQFSSKERDSATGFYYYGLRYYNSGLGRWLNRDPLGESGGVNLYCFIGNNPCINYDSFGLEKCKDDTCTTIALKAELGAYVGIGASASISAFGTKCNCCPCGTQSVDVGVAMEIEVGVGLEGDLFGLKLGVKGPQVGGSIEEHYVKDCEGGQGEVRIDRKFSAVFGYEGSADATVGASGAISIEVSGEYGLAISSSEAYGYIDWEYEVTEEYTVYITTDVAGVDVSVESTITKILSSGSGEQPTPKLSW